MAKLDEIIKQHAEHINRTSEEFLEAVRKSGMSYNESGELCNPVGRKLVPAENQNGALSIVYHYFRKEALKASSPVESTVISGTADVSPSDGGKTQAIKKVMLPTLIEILAKELHCSSEIAQEAITQKGILYDIREDRFYNPQVGEDILVEFEEVVKCGRDYLASLVAPVETLPKAEAAVLPAVEEGVALPAAFKESYLKNLVREFNKPPEELEKVLSTGGYFVGGGGFYHISGADINKTCISKKVPEKKVRDFLWEHYTAPADKVVVAQAAVAPVAQESVAPADLETAVDDGTVNIDEDIILDDDVETGDPLNVQLTLEEREAYIGPLARVQGKPLERIEAVLAEKEVYAGKDGKFYHRLPERDGSLKGEEIPLTDVNNILADYFAAERLPIITAETATAEKKDVVDVPIVPLPEKTHPVTSDPHDRTVGDWFDKGEKIGEETHHPDTNGELEKAIAETAAVNPEDIVKRSWQSYVAGGVGILLAAGVIYGIGYVAGKIVGESGKTVTETVVDNTLVDQLNGQLASQREELKTVYSDNDELNDENYLATRENDNLVNELGMLSGELEHRNIQYAALEQQLFAAPDAQEVNALREKSTALEMAREQASIKAQEAERKAGEWEVKYGGCSSAKDVCESFRKKEVETCNGYAADRDAVRAERDSLIAEKYGLTFDLENCLIAEGTPSIECTDRIVEKVVEKEYPIGDTKLPAKYEVCMIEKKVAVQTIEDADASYAVCEAEKEVVKSSYDSCVGELGEAGEKVSSVSDSRYVAIKEILESSKSDVEKGKELSKQVGKYILNVNGDESYGEMYVNGSSCPEVVSKLFSMMTSVKDVRLQEVFTDTLLHNSKVCNAVPPGTNYVIFKSKR